MLVRDWATTVPRFTTGYGFSNLQGMHSHMNSYLKIERLATVNPLHYYLGSCAGRLVPQPNGGYQATKPQLQLKHVNIASFHFWQLYRHLSQRKQCYWETFATYSNISLTFSVLLKPIAHVYSHIVKVIDNKYLNILLRKTCTWALMCVFFCVCKFRLYNVYI